MEQQKRNIPFHHQVMKTGLILLVIATLVVFFCIIVIF
jgi:hypothetical protein